MSLEYSLAFDSTAQSFSGQDFENNSANGLDFDLLLTESTSPIGVSQVSRQFASDWTNLPTTAFQDPHCGFHANIQAGPNNGLYFPGVVAEIEEAVDSMLSISIDNHDHSSHDDGAQSAHNLALACCQERYLINDQRSETQGSKASISNLRTSHGTLEAPTTSAEPAVAPVAKSGKRFRMPKKAESLLESVISTCHYPDNDHFAMLAMQTGVSEKRVRNWFRNRLSRAPRSECDTSSSHLLS